MDPSSLRARVESLVAEAVNLRERYPYADRDAFVDAMIDTANTLDDLDRIITAMYDSVTAALDRAGAVVEPCASGCGHVFAQREQGRPRRTCSGSCRVGNWRRSRAA